jgi:hypothetical protein
MIQATVVEKAKTHILCSINCFDNRADCEVMWENMVDPHRQPMTIWHMRIVCWVTKAEDTHSEYIVSYLLLFLCNNGCTNVPQCYVIRTLLSCY